MGNLLRLLAKEGDSCCSLPKQGDIFVDFERAVPNNEDAELYADAESVLESAAKILEELKNYKGASREIREAIAKPTEENEAAAWEALQPLVLKLRTFYDFSKALDAMAPKILKVLSESGEGQMNIVERLDDHQALVKQFAKLLDFVLRFDECKMTTPAVQNDFSYYRRTVSRNKSLFQPIVPLDVGNSMSLFFAHATPMLNALSGVVSEFFAAENNAVETLSVMAKVCQRMLDAPELKKRLIRREDTEPFILRVMTAAVILYDHVDPKGAFVKGASVDVKGCVRTLREYKTSNEGDSELAENLLNALRYTTKHLNDDTTPKSTKTLLFDDL